MTSPNFKLQFTPNFSQGFDLLFGHIFDSDDADDISRLNLLALFTGGVETIGELIVLKSSYPSNANHDVQQVKGSGFAGAGSATVTGLLTTDTITSSGTAPTCTTNGTLTINGDCWDIVVERDGETWAYWPGINIDETTELDASLNGNHLTDLTATTIAEFNDGSGTDYCNITGFSNRENLMRPSGTYGANYVAGYGWGATNSSGNITRVVDTWHFEQEGDSCNIRYNTDAEAGVRSIFGVLLTPENSTKHCSLLSVQTATSTRLCKASGWQYFIVDETAAFSMPDYRVGGITGGNDVDVTIEDVLVTTVNNVTPSFAADFVFLGDSTTSATYGYPEYFAKLFHTSTVVNSGVGGDDIADMIARFETDVAAYDPDYVVLMCGINDIVNGRTLTQMQADVQTIINLVSGIDAKLILMENTPWGGAASWTLAKQELLESWIAYLKTVDSYLYVENYDDLLDSVEPYNMVVGGTPEGLHPSTSLSPILSDNLAAALGISFPGYIETVGSQIFGRQPAGYLGVTDNQGPLGCDLEVVSGDTYPNITVKAPLGPKFQAIPEWTGEAEVDLSTFVDTTKTRFGPDAGVIYEVDQDTDAIEKIDKYTGDA